MKYLLPLLLMSLFAADLMAQDSPFLVRRFPKQIEVRTVVEPQTASRNTFEQLLVIPIPRSDEKRDIHNLRITMPAGMVADLQTIPESGDLYLPVVTRGALREPVIIEYEATLYTVHYNLPTRELPYDTTTSLYRENTGGFRNVEPDHPRIAEISDRIWRESSGVIDYARRIYHYQQQTFKWKDTGRYQTVSEIVANDGGDCGALTTIYLSLLRRQGIPARANLGGVILGQDRFAWHAWPEFYLEGHGWVEVDPSYFFPQPGYFAYVDDRRLHFHRTGRGTIAYGNFRFEISGIQSYALYRRGVTGAVDEGMSSEQLAYSVKTTVTTTEMPAGDAGLNRSSQVEQMTERLYSYIESERQAAGLRTERDTAASGHLTAYLQSQTHEVNRRSLQTIERDCRSGCFEELIESRSASTPSATVGVSAWLKEHGVRYTGMSWWTTNVGFYATDPLPHMVTRIDRALLLHPELPRFAVGYLFDPIQRRYRFIVMALR